MNAKKRMDLTATATIFALIFFIADILMSKIFLNLMPIPISLFIAVVFTAILLQ